MKGFRTRRFSVPTAIGLTLIAFNAAGCPDTQQTQSEPNEPIPTDQSSESKTPSQSGPASSQPSSDDSKPGAETPADSLASSSASGIALGHLQMESTTRPYVTLESKIPVFVEANVGVPDASSGDTLLGAISYFDKFKDFYRLDEPASQLFLLRAEVDADGEHLFFGQQQDGVVVHGAEIAIHISNGRVIGTSGRYLPEIPAFGEEMLGGDSAQIIAASSVGLYAENAEGVPAKMYFNEKLLGGETDRTRMVWKVAVRGDCGTSSGCQLRHYFVDAHSGEVVRTEELELHCDKDFDIQTANNSSSSSCWGGVFETQDEYWFDEDGVWCGIFAGCARPDADGWAAYNGAHRVYDFFANTFGRCGWDGNDAQLEAYVHSGMDVNNASYSPGCDHLRFGTGVVSLDTFAHEYTHAVTRWTANLPASFAGGAINEHYSDVMAAVITGDWVIGEGDAPGPARNMATPSIAPFRDPDHMQAAQCTAGKGFQNLPNTQAGDFGGVHTNAGILNKASFLIADGGSHKGINVTGIGRDKMGRLYYTVLTSRLTSNAQFIDVRNNSVAVAREWAQAGNRNGFTMRDVCSVINAFAAVGLGAKDLDCDGWDDNEDADDDADYVPDFRDNCPNVKNPDQENNDGDAEGDACDNDDDNDGVADNVDNCRFRANADQSDRDRDGVGDVCDNCPDHVDFFPRPDGGIRRIADPDQTDSDHDGQGNLCDDDDDNDGIRDNFDNCPTVRNPDQWDFDGNGIGLACDAREQEERFGHEAAPDPKNWTKLKLCAGGCPDWFFQRYESVINVTLPYRAIPAIVDRYGAVVGKTEQFVDNDGSMTYTFRFKPRTQMRYRFPASASKYIQGLPRENGQAVLESSAYYLRLHATDWNGQPFDAEPIELRVQPIQR